MYAREFERENQSESGKRKDLFGCTKKKNLMKGKWKKEREELKSMDERNGESDSGINSGSPPKDTMKSVHFIFRNSDIRRSYVVSVENGTKKTACSLWPRGSWLFGVETAFS